MPISARMAYGDLVLPLVFAPIVLAALVYTVRAVVGWAAVRGEAQSDYDYRAANGMVPRGVGQQDYIATYRRVNGPRGSIHAAAALWAMLLATPLIAVIMEFLLNQLWLATGQSRVFEPGYLVWAFFIFFGLMGAWAAIGFIAARRYHKHAPARFEDELRRRSVTL